MIIQPGVHVIVVAQLWHIANMFMRHLKDWDTDCHVIGSMVVFSILVFEVLLFYESEKFGVVCSKMAHYKTGFAVIVRFPSYGGILTGIANSTLGR